MTINIPIDSEYPSFKTNIVFAARDIGNIYDNSINFIKHIIDSDIIYVESIKNFELLLKKINIFTKAKIVESTYDEKIATNNNKIIIEESKTKKILIVSDEGSSIIIDLGKTLLHQLQVNNIEYSILPGPSAVTQALSFLKYSQDFYFAGMIISGIQKNNVYVLKESEKIKDIFTKIKNNNCPNILFTIQELFEDTVKEIVEFFGNDCSITVFKNLTMDNELIKNDLAINFLNKNFANNGDQICLSIHGNKIYG